jgi:lipid-A-disaccharide synthase
MTAQSEIIGDEPRSPNLLALLPGSREREVRKIFPALLAAAKIVLARRPQTVLASAASSEKLQHLMREMAAQAGVGCDIGLRNARDLMQTAAAGLVASGTATLEATLNGLPYALVYKVAPLTYLAGRAVIKVPHLGMANILAGKEIVKEFIQQDAAPTNLAAEALRLLDDAAYRDRMREDFSKVRTKLIAPAAVSPARAVLEVLS